MSRNTGMTRPVDQLGRIVIPMEIRKNLGIKTGEYLELHVADNGDIIFRKRDIAEQAWEIVKAAAESKPIDSRTKTAILDLDKVIKG